MLYLQSEIKVRVISARDQSKRERKKIISLEINYERNQKKQQNLKDIPIFENEDQERDFWATHSDLDFPGRFKPVNSIYLN
jgi:hypothetical protein